MGGERHVDKAQCRDRYVRAVCDVSVKMKSGATSRSIPVQSYSNSFYVFYHSIVKCRIQPLEIKKSLTKVRCYHLESEKHTGETELLESHDRVQMVILSSFCILSDSLCNNWKRK